MNLLVLRFANICFEAIWNHHHIASVQVIFKVGLHAAELRCRLAGQCGRRRGGAEGRGLPLPAGGGLAATRRSAARPNIAMFPATLVH